MLTFCIWLPTCLYLDPLTLQRNNRPNKTTNVGLWWAKVPTSLHCMWLKKVGQLLWYAAKIYTLQHLCERLHPLLQLLALSLSVISLHIRVRSQQNQGTQAGNLSHHTTFEPAALHNGHGYTEVINSLPICICMCIQPIWRRQ